MEEILFRSFRKEDAEGSRRLIGDAWYPKDSFSDQALRKDIINLEAMYALFASDWCLVAETEGEVKGVIYGRFSRRRAFFGNFPRCFPLFWTVLKLLFRSRASRRALAEEWDYSRAMRKLKRGKDLKKTAECTLFIVKSDLRGRGLGKKLMGELVNKARENGKRAIHLFTDTSCNYGFYDALGFERLSSHTLSFRSEEEKEETFDVYLYKKDIE